MQVCFAGVVLGVDIRAGIRQIPNCAGVAESRRQMQGVSLLASRGLTSAPCAIRISAADVLPYSAV